MALLVFSLGGEGRRVIHSSHRTSELDVSKLQGICFCVRRTVDGQNSEGRRGVRGYGGSEGLRKDEAGFRCCSESRISGGETRWWRSSCAQALFRQRALVGCCSVASVRIEDEEVTVFEWDPDWPAGFGALVEQVEAWLAVVGMTKVMRTRKPSRRAFICLFLILNSLRRAMKANTPRSSSAETPRCARADPCLPRRPRC